jgi:uncharacterized membrane protein (DUF373 family)
MSDKCPKNAIRLKNEYKQYKRIKMITQIAFTIVLVALGVIYGKLFCGKICPFGMIQDWVFKIPFPKKIKNE